MSVRDIIQAAAGSGGDKLYVEDVFSTYLYTGNGSTQTITNGIDLAGEGGLVWLKSRSATTNHFLFDTNRGVLNELNSDLTEAQASLANSLTSFNANGFSLGNATGINVNTARYASWTFRKAPKFFDVVTYTGDGVYGRQIPHNLGSVPGMIICKKTNNSGAWLVYHRSFSNQTNDYAVFNNSVTVSTAGSAVWGAITSSSFTVDAFSGLNASGDTYVAYLFAHDAGGFGDTGTNSVVACGSYTGNGSANGPVINLGWEPQYVMIKSTGIAGDWLICDIMRGMPDDSNGARLAANITNAEILENSVVRVTPTGFQPRSTSDTTNGASQTYIYLAIRRPMKTPESGTEVFSPIARAGTGANATITTNFVADLVISSIRTAASGVGVFDRLRGLGRYLQTNATGAEASDTTTLTGFDSNTGYRVGTDSSGLINLSGQNYVNWNFRRAPGFFDVVCYTGTNPSPALQTVNHNLTVVPELIIAKNRTDATNSEWVVWHTLFGVSNDQLYLNSNSAVITGAGNITAPTASTFLAGYGRSNSSGKNYVAYLFASLPGVSKVGSYTGTGTTQDINCGFTTGARFVMIKRTDSTGNWYVWDTARGIVSGNDPYITINSPLSNPQEVTNTDYIDPLASGFQISSTAPAEINASGGSYIYLAIA